MTSKRGSRERRVLLSFAGFHDPFSEGPITGTQEEGPVLRLVRLHPVDTLVLFSTPPTALLTESTQSAAKERHPTLEVEVRHLPLVDPTSYVEILAALRAHFQDLSKHLENATYFVGTASGTPQMHASWVLLVASGEIPARLLQVRPSHFVTEENPALTELNPTGPEFPEIRAKVWADVRVDEDDAQHTNHVIESLGIIGDHPVWVRALETATLLARSDVPVLVLGESGTGKEKLARLIHALSDRASKPFVPVNCAAVPVSLAESTFFGHVRGAFTGAAQDHPGKFVAASEGTLFLDEIAELPPEVQAKLLRAIQEGVIEPLGSSKDKKVNVRLIAATNRDLKEAVAQGKFRDDLYYRLAVGEVHLPPLRERRSDITKLAVWLLDDVNRRLRKPRRFAPETLAALQSHSWPGNIRMLRNVIERAALLSRSDEIRPEHVELSADDRERTIPDPYEGFSMEEYLGSLRRQLFERALAISEGNQSRAARLLGITPQAVFKYTKG